MSFLFAAPLPSFTAFTCEWQHPVQASCPDGYVIQVIRAFYGRRHIGMWVIICTVVTSSTSHFQNAVQCSAFNNSDLLQKSKSLIKTELQPGLDKNSICDNQMFTSNWNIYPMTYACAGAVAIVSLRVKLKAHKTLSRPSARCKGRASWWHRVFFSAIRAVMSRNML